MEEELRGFYTPDKIDRLCSLLVKGRIAVLPTDTIYGLHCISTDKDAVRTVRRMKGRADQAGFILIAADISMVDDLVSEWPPRIRELLSEIWPAGLTAILPADLSLHEELRPRGKVAVRVPGLGILREITAGIGAPMISTSANRSGQPPMTAISAIRKEFPGLAAYISRSGRPASKASTVVDFSVYPFRIVREGAFDISQYKEKR
ncbi:MAG TPA: L-threonylcarbamoyladenylate synthase [Candidatus Krumholzibacterium sp.]|nr:L-threonylcarbamoyladenylate synthase [Candidatus Krumholzibacterium sp.]